MPPNLQQPICEISCLNREEKAQFHHTTFLYQVPSPSWLFIHLGVSREEMLLLQRPMELTVPAKSRTNRSLFSWSQERNTGSTQAILKKGKKKGPITHCKEIRPLCSAPGTSTMGLVSLPGSFHPPPEQRYGARVSSPRA